MAKLFVVSDIHGFFTELKKALDDAGFDQQNPKHMLVSCGDAMDRGPQPREVIEFLNGLPNKVLITGNHEILMEDAIRRKCFLAHDFHNGTANTAYDFCKKENAGLMSHAQILGELRDDPEYQKYKSLLVNYFETENYIFCHSWVPGGKDWRYVSQSKWNKAMWGNPFDIAAVVGNKTGKTIVHGHWHNSTGWWQKGIGSEFDEDACFDIIEHDGCIGLDACTAYTHKVNVLVLEDKFLEEE